MTNMKNRLTALLLALMLLLTTVSAFAETTTTEAPTIADDAILASLNGEPVTKAECDEYISYYASQYSLTYADAVDYFLHQLLFTDKIKEFGFDKFTDEENADFTAQAQAQWDDAIQSYVEYFLTEDTDEARATVTQQANEYYANYGYSVEGLAENLKLSKGYELLETYLLGDQTVTDEQIQSTYDQTVEQQKAAIGDSAMMYEMYSYYYGDMYYIPAGYRSVLHILLKVDDALLTAYTDAQTAYSDLRAKMDEQTAAASAEATTAPEASAEATAEPEAPVTLEQIEAAKLAVEEARVAVLASKATELNDIETRLAGGEDFKTLIGEYNADTGEDVEVGYNVHKDSMTYDEAFTAGAFSDKMQQIGDHSDPVVGSYGIHIIYYLADVPEGALAMTEAVRAELEAQLKNEMLYNAQVKAYDEWVTSYTIVKDDAAIAQLDGTAAAE